MDDLDKHCSLSWDEMALTKHLNFCSVKDSLDGFVDLGHAKIPDFAAHALVFMIRGINKAYKQPVAYFFTKDLDAIELSQLIRLVTRKILDTGMLDNTCFAYG